MLMRMMLQQGSHDVAQSFLLTSMQQTALHSKHWCATTDFEWCVQSCDAQFEGWEVWVDMELIEVHCLFVSFLVLLFLCQLLLAPPVVIIAVAAAVLHHCCCFSEKTALQSKVDVLLLFSLTTMPKLALSSSSQAKQVDHPTWQQ